MDCSSHSDDYNKILLELVGQINQIHNFDNVIGKAEEFSYSIYQQSQNIFEPLGLWKKFF